MRQGSAEMTDGARARVSIALSSLARTAGMLAIGLATVSGVATAANASKGAKGAASKAPVAAQQSFATIEAFTPQGQASGVEAVQLTFAESVAAFGDPDSKAPILLECKGPVPEGAGRWLDDRRWVHTFAATVPAGVACNAHPNPDFRDLKGHPLSPTTKYAFHTGAPQVVEFRPFPGMDIDEEQIFIVRFDAPVDAQAVAAHSHCVVEGIGERIPVKAVAAAPTETLLEASYMQAPADAATLALLQCGRTLPPESAVRLEIGPGIAAVGQPASLRPTRRAHVLEYKVRPPFLAKLSCTRERAGSPCLPITPMRVDFTAPVARASLKDISLRGESRSFTAEIADDGEFVSSITFPSPFPAKTTLRLELPAGLVDDAQRPLANAERFPLKVPVGDYPPLAKFASGSFGVIERFAHAKPQEGNEEGAAVPVTIRHIESDPVLRAIAQPVGQVTNLHAIDDLEVLRWYARLQRLDSGSWSKAQLTDILEDRAPRDDYGPDVERIDVRGVSLLASQPSVQRMTLPERAPGQGPFEVLGIPIERPGFHVLELESPALGASLLEDGGPMYVRTGVLLTNLAVHVKQGRDDLMVWVTTLSEAESVADAQITVRDCDGKLLAEGHSDAQGVWNSREPLQKQDYCAATGLGGVFVSARIGAEHPLAYGSADYAFALSDWDRGIETWRFNVPTSSETQPELLTHTVFDRSLFRAGETVSMKHFLREETREGLALPASRRPDRLVIEHEGSSQRHELPVAWQDTPSGGLVALNEFPVPESALLGTYTVRLTDEEQNWYGSTTFRVEEFRLPILAGTLSLRGGERPGTVIAPSSLSVDLQLNWLSGGPAADQRVTLSALAEDRVPSFAAYDDYVFYAPPFDPSNPQAATEEGPQGMDEGAPRRNLFLNDREVVLNGQGAAEVEVTPLPPVAGPQRYRLEATFADPSGEIQTLANTVEVWPSAVQAGLKAEGWVEAQRDIPISLLALGIEAQPRAGVPMRLLAIERKMYTVRKRMVGGFYRYDTHTERGPATQVCEGVTGADGTLRCIARFDRAGSYELVAMAADDQGRESRAYVTTWVSGNDELWFGGQDDDRIDLIPARREWVAGEEAEFQVRMPFREAVALVSVEREGVLWSRQVKLQGTDPVIRIPIDASWGPNVYVSALVLRGRLYPLSWRSFSEWGWRDPAAWMQAYGENPEDRLVTSRIDLAKPAFRFGLSEIKIQGQADRLRVELVPQKDVLNVREEAVVRVKVALPDGSPAANASVAFAAVDDALLELAPNDSWKLYEAMHPRRSLGVRTATSQMEVVGRRHYGRKAVAAGGGGGMLPTRQLFDTLVSWQPMVQLDANGEALIRFHMNDSLSRFTLVAVADYGPAYFGVASATVVTHQDLQLVSGLPIAVREGDAYQAAITLRNSSEQTRELRVQAVARHNGQENRLPERQVTLAAGQAVSVRWPVVAPLLEWPQQGSDIVWRFEAADDAVSDSITLTQALQPRVPTGTVQAALFDVQPGPAVERPVTVPADALRDEDGTVLGGLALDVSTSLAGGSLQGVRQWWLDYPYTCLEQTASQALGLNDEARWKAVVARIGTHIDDDGLLRYFPGTWPGSDVLTAYIVSAADDAQQVGIPAEIPQDLLERMLDGLQAFAEGQIKRGDRDQASSVARRIMAMEALSRHDRVTPTMLGSVEPALTQWSTPTLANWVSILTRMQSGKNTKAGLTQARNVLSARMSVSGAALSFADTPLNTAPELMASRVTGLARLMLAVMERPEWQSDLPRMARGLVEAQSNGSWAMTTENLLAQLALARFSQRFEAEPSTGVVNARVMPQGGTATIELRSDEAVAAHLGWPRGEGNLSVQHQGQGRAWVSLRAQAAVKRLEARSAGYEIARRVIPVQQHEPGRWSRGDILRVEVDIQARDGAAWVVLNDPVPAGATILGSGLGRDASAQVAGQQATSYYAPVFVERASTAYRAYFDYLPAGRITVSYTVRLNTQGTFAQPPTRVEALYRPDLYGLAPNQGIEVQAGPFDTPLEGASGG